MDLEFFMHEVTDYLLFEYNTSQRWPFAVPFERVTMEDLRRIAVRAQGFSARPATMDMRFDPVDGSVTSDTELIHGCCIAILGNR